MFTKKLNIVLIILVTLIWGKLLLNLIRSVKPNSPALIQTTHNKQKLVYKKNNYKLVLPDRNPFQKQKSNKKKIKNINPISIKRKKNINKKKRNINIEKKVNIVYYGYFQEIKKSQTPKVIIRIDQKLYKKRIPFKVGNIYIKKFYKDSLIVYIKNKKHTINRQK